MSNLTAAGRRLVEAALEAAVAENGTRTQLYRCPELVPAHRWSTAKVMRCPFEIRIVGNAVGLIDPEIKHEGKFCHTFGRRGELIASGDELRWTYEDSEWEEE